MVYFRIKAVIVYTAYILYFVTYISIIEVHKALAKFWQERIHPKTSSCFFTMTLFLTSTDINEFQVCQDLLKKNVAHFAAHSQFPAHYFCSFLFSHAVPHVYYFHLLPRETVWCPYSPCGVLGGDEADVCVMGEEDTVLTDWCATATV